MSTQTVSQAVSTTAPQSTGGVDLGTQSGHVDMSEGAALADLFKGKGKVDPRTVSALATSLTSALAAEKSADAVVTETEAALAALGETLDTHLVKREVAQVKVARIAFLLTHPKTPRGVTSTSQGALAKVSGISRTRLNQYAAVGYAEYLANKGTYAPEVTAGDRAFVKALDKARKDGADLTEVVAQVERDASGDDAPKGAAAVRQAAAVVKDAARTEPKVVTVKSQHARIESALQTLTGADAVNGTAAEVAAMLAALERTARFLRSASVTVLPEPEPKVTASK